MGVLFLPCGFLLLGCADLHGVLPLLSCSVVSDSSWPFGLSSTRLLCPWEFSGKPAGVGCHFPPLGDLPDPVIEPSSSTSPALHVDYLLAEPFGDARVIAWKRIIRALITKTVLSLWKFEEFRGYLLGTGNKGQSNSLLYSRATPKHSNGKKNQKVRASRGRNWSHTKVCILYDINILNSNICC